MGLLAALLDVALHEVLGIGLEDLVDLVEQVVEFGLEFLPRSDADGLSAVSFSRSLGAGLRICSRSAMTSPGRSVRSEPPEQLGSAFALVEQGTHMGTGPAHRLHHRHPPGASEPTSKTRESQLAATTCSGNVSMQRPRK